MTTLNHNAPTVWPGGQPGAAGGRHGRAAETLGSVLLETDIRCDAGRDSRGWAGLPPTEGRRSMIVALAGPPPSHMVCGRNRPPVRSSDDRRVAVSLVPLAPMGWPRAMAPPLTLTRSR